MLYTLSCKTEVVFFLFLSCFKMKNWEKLIEKENKKIEKIEKAKEKALEKSDRKAEKKALKRFEKLADKELSGIGF